MTRYKATSPAIASFRRGDRVHTSNIPGGREAKLFDEPPTYVNGTVVVSGVGWSMVLWDDDIGWASNPNKFPNQYLEMGEIGEKVDIQRQDVGAITTMMTAEDFILFHAAARASCSPLLAPYLDDDARAKYRALVQRMEVWAPHAWKNQTPTYNTADGAAKGPVWTQEDAPAMPEEARDFWSENGPGSGSEL